MKTTVKKYIWQCWYVLLALFATMFININLDKKLSLQLSLSGNNILYVLLFFVYLIGLKKIAIIKNRRLKICVRYSSFYFFIYRNNRF